MARGILRGGLAGAMLAVAFSVLGVIPVCGFVALPLRFLAWAAGGYIAGRLVVQSGARNFAVAAGAGAGVISGIIDGLANIALAPLRYQLAGGITGLSLLPQGFMGLFADLGIDLLAMDTTGGSIFFAVLLCGVTWLISGAVGMIAGGIAQALAE